MVVQFFLANNDQVLSCPPGLACLNAISSRSVFCSITKNCIRHRMDTVVYFTSISCPMILATTMTVLLITVCCYLVPMQCTSAISTLRLLCVYLLLLCVYLLLLCVY